MSRYVFWILLIFFNYNGSLLYDSNGHFLDFTSGSELKSYFSNICQNFSRNLFALTKNFVTMPEEHYFLSLTDFQKKCFVESFPLITLILIGLFFKQQIITKNIN